MKLDRPDKPDHDFVLEDEKGRATHYIDIKTPVDPSHRPLEKQAIDIAHRLVGKGSYPIWGKGTNTDVILELKKLDSGGQTKILNELQNLGVDLNKLIILNRK